MSEKKTRPSHRLFAVRSYSTGCDEKSSWTEIGVVFPNKNGFTVQLHAMPLDGRCIALSFDEKRSPEPQD